MISDTKHYTDTGVNLKFVANYSNPKLRIKTLCGRWIARKYLVGPGTRASATEATCEECKQLCQTIITK